MIALSVFWKWLAGNLFRDGKLNEAKITRLGHAKRLKLTPEGYSLRGKPGPRYKQRKTAHFSATCDAETAARLRRAGLGGQAIFELGVQAALEKCKMEDCV